MALTTFVDSVTRVTASWLNQIDIFVNTLFAGATTAAQARTAIDAASISTNETITGAKTFSATSTFNGQATFNAGVGVIDSQLIISDNADATKILKFECSSIGSGQTRVITIPNASTTLVGTDISQTLTNKTLTSPVISAISNTGTITLPTSTVTLGGVLDRQLTTQLVSNTTTETQVYSFSVLGNTLGTNRALRITIFGDRLNNTGGVQNETIRIKFGATTIATATTGGTSASATRAPWKLVCNLFAFNGATNTQKAFYEYAAGTSPGAGAIAGTDNDSSGGLIGSHLSIAEDDTTAKTLAVTIQLGTASANMNHNVFGVFVELI